jgi:transposase
MAYSYLPVDRDQLFLMPPSVRDWLAADHLVWFVLDVVARVDTAGLHARHRNSGVGRRAYDPEMLLALLVYAYCTGVRSSRQIERLCEVDVAYRVVSANLVADHTTIARFRQDHQPEAVRLFTDVLMLCASCGLAKVGVIAVDGTKIAGQASLKANRTRAQIEAEVAKLFAEAGVVDEAEDALFGEGCRGDDLPVELIDPRSRRVRLDAALRELERARAAREAEREAEREAVRQVREQAEREAAAQGRGVNGVPPAGSELERAEQALVRVRERATVRRADVERRATARGCRPTPTRRDGGYRVWKAEQRVANARAKETARDAKDRSEQRKEPVVNVTDPDSRIMKTAHGWVQGYNAQAAVNEDGVILAAAVTQDVNDVGQCEPMIAAINASLTGVGVDKQIGIMLFDAGYLSDDNLTTAGPDRLIATSKAWKLRHSEPTSGPAPEELSPLAAMHHRLRTPEGAALYGLRQHTVEPVFGTIKEQRGYRRFTRRGLAAVTAEWQLITAAHNIIKLFHHYPGPLPTP